MFLIKVSNIFLKIQTKLDKKIVLYCLCYSAKIEKTLTRLRPPPWSNGSDLWVNKFIVVPGLSSKIGHLHNDWPPSWFLCSRSIDFANNLFSFHIK